jgi:uncharacterized protein (TIGR00730 family)
MMRSPVPQRPFGEVRLVVRAVLDFVGGFRTLRAATPCVTVFGSARCREDHPYYALGRAIGARLTQSGFTVMTGGGPGLMEAANRGAKEAGGRSMACCIDLPIEQSTNPFVDRWVSCKHFFVRKVLLFKYSLAFVALPGGLGTMDELFEALTLVQTGKIEPFPIVLLDSAYWQPVVELLGRMVTDRMVDPQDVNLVMVTDDVDEAVRHIREHVAKQFGLEPPRHAVPRPPADRLAPATR